MSLLVMIQTKGVGERGAPSHPRVKIQLKVLFHLCYAFWHFKQYRHPNATLRNKLKFPQGTFATRTQPSHREISNLTSWRFNLKDNHHTAYEEFIQFSIAHRIAKIYTTTNPEDSYKSEDIHSFMEPEFEEFVKRVKPHSNYGRVSTFQLRRLSAWLTTLSKASHCDLIQCEDSLRRDPASQH